MADWFVVDHETNAVVRGPYRSVHTAGAVREEMERGGDERNLWIIRKPAHEPVSGSGASSSGASGGTTDTNTGRNDG